jgi:cyclopropane fatty-acyl-phospholipid synthase-like methyltransferase
MRVRLPAAVLTGALIWPAGIGASGQPAGRAPDVVFIPTPPPVVSAMLKAADVGPHDVVYDLGSGDGRIVIEAAKTFGARGVGFDLDQRLIDEARLRARNAGVAGRVRFERKDLFEVDLRPATVVTLYLLPEMNARLRPKLQRELRPGARIVAHSFAIPGWRPERRIEVGERSIFLWTMRGAAARP